MTYSAEDAITKAIQGIKVRHSTWADDQYVRFNIYGQLCDENDSPIGPKVVNSIFDNHPLGWEDYASPDEEEVVRDIKALEPEPKNSEDQQHKFWFGPKHPKPRCDCGGQYVDGNHSDWCSSLKVLDPFADTDFNDWEFF